MRMRKIRAAALLATVAAPVHGTTSPYYTLEAVGSCPGGYW